MALRLEPMVAAVLQQRLDDAMHEEMTRWVEACQHVGSANLDTDSVHRPLWEMDADGWLFASRMIDISWDLWVKIPQSHYESAKRVSAKAKEAIASHKKAIPHLEAAALLLKSGMDAMADTPYGMHRLAADARSLTDRLLVVIGKLEDIKRSASEAAKLTTEGAPRHRGTNSVVAFDGLLSREGLDASQCNSFTSAYLRVFLGEASMTSERVRQRLKDHRRRQARKARAPR